MTDFVLQVGVSGLLLGGVYALISAGLNLIFGVVRIINFAHGELVMIAMYITYWMFVGYRMDPYVSILVVVPVVFVIGMVLQRVVIQPIQGASATMKIFATVGVALVLRNLALMLFGGEFRSVRTAYSTSTIEIGDVFVSVPRLIAFCVALVLFLVLYFFLKRSYMGKAFQAVAENRTVAQLMGIRVERLYLIAFGLGTVLAGVAGALLMPFASVYPSIGLQYTLVAFVVVVLGGLGNMVGTLLAGLFIGLVEAFFGTFISPALQEASYFIIFIVVLLIRPQGLFGSGKGTEEVGLK